jgi:geranylgeranyl diphosphate synthase type II
MITPSDRAAIDRSIDRSLARMRERAGTLGEAFHSLVASIERAAAGGKRWRPALVVASFESFGGSVEHQPALYDIATAFELLHTSFVVHDDVIDHDTVRRGIPNVGGEFRARATAMGADAAGSSTLGDAAAILAGDLLLHEASRIVALAELDPTLRRRVLDLFDDAVYVSAAGELADVENSITSDVAQSPAILDAAFNKTAVYSFRAPLVAGGLLAEAGDDAIAVLESAGGRVGLAFQLVDDLIGAFGTEAQAGRDEGGDLRESKRTPLVALARESPTWPKVSDALAVAHTGPIAVREAQRALEESGARARLRVLIDETLDDVRFAASDPALPGAASTLLRTLADDVERRVP